MIVKKKSLMFLMTPLLIINCAPKVDVINEVPNHFFGTLYEISNKVIKRFSIPDSIVVYYKHLTSPTKRLA